MATPVYALAGSLTSGYVAGAEAASFARSVGHAEPSREALAAERDRVVAPMSSGRGKASSLGWEEFERELQGTMTRYVGMDRHAGGLGQAQRYLEAYRAASVEVRATNPHELMRSHEAFDLCLFDAMMTAAALERDETRFNFVMGHRRSDYPEPDDATWKGVAVVVSHDGEAPVVKRTVPNPWWREGELAADTPGGRPLAGGAG
jgi:succinate dehydrogenase/fumarate reductase flavoprotein subunit